jgi:tetratricopeptide (TPR) repeat protein
MKNELSIALDLHNAGRLDEAEPLYREILAVEPTNVAALNLLGMIHHARGNHGQAAELLGQAAALRPDIRALHINHAEMYRALGQHERVVEICREALRHLPDDPEMLCNLGVTLQTLGRREEALAELYRSVELRPDYAAGQNNLGILLGQLGRTDEAIARFRRAIELGPEFAPFRTNLGQILLSIGRPDEALFHCMEAVRLQPEVASFHYNLGNALRALGRLNEARASSLEALRIDPGMALAHAQHGLILRGQGRYDEAWRSLTRAAELEMDNPVFWEYLAELCSEADEHARGIVAWKRVLALTPAPRAAQHIEIGRSLQEENRLAEAETHYRAAASLDPRDPAAPLNLGAIHIERGEVVEAEDAYRRAIAIDPSFAIAHTRLAMLLGAGLPDADLARLELLIDDPRTATAPLGRLWFAVAYVLDARGDYPGAADAARRANALISAVARGLRAYSPDVHDTFIDGLIRGFHADFFERTAAGGLNTRRPVFVFGLPRSGTTLVEQVLASHPAIFGAGELRLAERSFNSIPSLLGRQDRVLDCIPGLDATTIERMARQHLGQFEALADPKAERIVDKMTDNYSYLGLLAACFPDATFIHCRRDLRDIAVSCWINEFRNILWTNEQHHIASRFRAYRRLMDHWRAVLPATVHVVDYEETVADLEGTARRLVAAVGLEWDPACLEFHRTKRPVRTSSLAQVRRPIYQSSVARWKHYESELGELFAALPADEQAPQRSTRDIDGPRFRRVG